MVGWHHRLSGHGFGWTPGVGDEQGSLVCCGSWSPKELDTIEWLNWTEPELSHIPVIRLPPNSLCHDLKLRIFQQNIIFISYITIIFWIWLFSFSVIDTGKWRQALLLWWCLSTFPPLFLLRKIGDFLFKSQCNLICTTVWKGIDICGFWHRIWVQINYHTLISYPESSFRMNKWWAKTLEYAKNSSFTIFLIVRALSCGSSAVIPFQQGSICDVWGKK